MYQSAPRPHPGGSSASGGPAEPGYLVGGPTSQEGTAHEGHPCCLLRRPPPHLRSTPSYPERRRAALSARPPGEVRCGRGRGGGGGSRGRGRGLVARVAAAQAASARPQPTAAAAVQAADAVPALEAAAALPVAADVQSHSDECKESPTSLAVPHGKGPACLGATGDVQRLREEIGKDAVQLSKCQRHGWIPGHWGVGYS